MAEVTLEEAVNQCLEALGALREADRELGWALARERLDDLDWLLDDDDTPTVQEIKLEHK